MTVDNDKLGLAGTGYIDDIGEALSSIDDVTDLIDDFLDPIETILAESADQTIDGTSEIDYIGGGLAHPWGVMSSPAFP